MKKSNNTKRKLIEITSEMIEKNGINNVSIRKVTANAGYTSATIYLHFKNFDHLLFISSLKFLNYYNENLESYVSEKLDILQENLAIWKFFCSCSFNNPEIFYFIFFTSTRFIEENPEDYYEIKEFYNLFPEERYKISSTFYPMLLKLNLKERNKFLILKLVKNKIISPSHISLLNQSQIYIYKGYLEEAIQTTDLRKRKRIETNCINALKKLYSGYIIKRI